MPIPIESTYQQTAPTIGVSISNTTPTTSAITSEVATLSEEALVSLVLRTTSRRGGTPMEQARRLLSSFGSLQNLATAGHAEVAEIAEIPTAKAAALQAAFELGRRLLCEPISRGQSFTCSRDIYNAFAPILSHREKESFWVLLLDQRNRLLRQIEIAKGSINRCPVALQEIFAPALREKAVGMVFMHNHPSGDPEPSTEDRSLTRRLNHIAELHHIEILDHLIFGDTTYVSFADRGWL